MRGPSHVLARPGSMGEPYRVPAAKVLSSIEYVAHDLDVDWFWIDALIHDFVGVAASERASDTRRHMSESLLRDASKSSTLLLVVTRVF